MYTLQLHLRDIDTAAHAWAAAAGHAGAMAPSLVRDALIRSGGDLVAAAIEGTAAAARQHAVDVAGGWTGPEPRGLEVEIRSGAVSAVTWRSEAHVIRLSPRHGGGWSVRVSSEASLTESSRCRAAVATAWAWRDAGDHEELARAASEVGLRLADDEIEPPPGFEDRAVERAQRDGILG